MTARIRIALHQLGIARRDNNPTGELVAESRLDHLVDMHETLLRANGKFRRLEELDPELAERLATPRPAIRLVPERRGRHRP